MKLAKGPYKVMRDCCTSGNCELCIGRAPLGHCVSVCQLEGLSKKSASAVARNFRSYNAKVVKMEATHGRTKDIQ